MGRLREGAGGGAISGGLFVQANRDEGEESRLGCRMFTKINRNGSSCDSDWRCGGLLCLLGGTYGL